MDLSTADRRRRRRRVADVDRKRAPRAGESLPGTELRTELPKQSPPQAPKTSPTLSDRGVVENSGLPSPASVLSHGLSKHVIADQSKRVLWPNILSRLREAFSLDPQRAPEEREMVAMQARMIQPKGLHPSELSRLHAAINAFPPRLVADFLVFIFIKHATDVFFYFDQAQMLSDIDEFYTDPRSSLRLDPAFICLAMATFALGSQWTPLERPEGLESGQQKDDVDLGREFSFHAKSLVPDIVERSCLRSIQAPFVLGVYFMPASAIGASYVFLGLALRKALASDLHLGSEDGALTDIEKEVRCRLWWSIFSLERCTTVKLNRPRSIDTQIITVPYPSKCIALDQVQKFENLDCQVAYVRLIRLLDEIAGVARVAALTRRRDGLPEPPGLSQSKWEADLKLWKQSLPIDLKLDRMGPSDLKYRAVSHLYLNYYYALITMGKVALVTVARTKLKQADGEMLDVSDHVKELAICCSKAAIKTLQLFESLNRSRKITRFSFTDFQGCSIATIVTLVSGILERDSSYDIRVNFGLNCLRKMATGNMTAKLGVRFVEAVQSITNEAARKRQLEASLPPDTSNSIHSGYYQWAEWLTVQGDSQRRPDSMVRLHEESPSARENRDQNSVPWLAAQSTFRDTSTWQIQIEQNTSETSSAPQNSLNESPESLLPMGYDFFSTLHSDEHSFLMGLTGLDALDFSGLTVQLE
ncbi:hypothetical protein N7481_007946 [Penicillium waksmanii]|uniref:uncharacterized protein n=1 Tax=Penicillium waksmanii TaxID=69791 RepID=UPI002547A3BE|nr:uncharacterized protein N7481_007946 [Penicillium waksmanii]KAJ5980648.1 hypothetical protein N7481_007946 [Penicillium waksmanii]